jgi:putative membrane protein insertion efficiency factor
MTPPTPPMPTGLGGRLVALPIVAYRRWVSPVLPARCRFYPSCSAYALEAVAVHGAWRGIGMAIWRLLRCHPFHPGGYDPVRPRAERTPANSAAEPPHPAVPPPGGRGDRDDVDVTGAAK